MHIIIGIFTAIIGLIWALTALRRTGFSFDSLNPFAWHRRHKWLSQAGDGPIYQLENPIEVVGVISLSVAKAKGELTRDTKNEIIDIFEKEFQIDNKTANDLLTASSYYLKNISSLKGKLKKVLTKSKERFTPHQIELAASMFERISISEGQASEEQIALITEFKQQFS